MWKKIARSKAISIVFLVAFAFTAAGWLWGIVALRGVANAPLILHFDDIEGITSVGGIGSLVFIGIFGSVVTLINFAIALELDARDRFLGKLAAAVTLIFAVLLFIGFAAIINVN